MAEYVNKEDAIKQIVKGEEMYGEEFATDTGRVKDFLGVLPSADVVEVVRCKDCKWYDADGEEMNTQGHCWYKNGEPVMQNMKPNDFCSYGERKQE